MSIPNTPGGWGLDDVRAELALSATASLQDCFTSANSALFDPFYEGSKDRLSNFRNYNSVFPYYVDNSSIIASTNTGSPLSVSYPISLDADDILIIIVYTLTTTGQPTTPSGWTLKTSFVDSGVNIYTYWKRSAGTESGSVNIVLGSEDTQDHYGYMLRFKKCVTTGDPFKNIRTQKTDVTYVSTPITTAILNFNTPATNILGVNLIRWYHSTFGGNKDEVMTYNGWTEEFGGSGIYGVEQSGTYQFRTLSQDFTTQGVNPTDATIQFDWTTVVRNISFYLYGLDSVSSESYLLSPTGRSSQATACSDTANTTRWSLASDLPLAVNSRVYTDESLTTVFNGGGLHYKYGIGTVQIGADGFVDAVDICI